MTAGVCVPQCVGECVSCVSEVNKCYCVRGETPPPSTLRSLPSRLLTAANLKKEPALTSALVTRHQQELTQLMQLMSKTSTLQCNSDRLLKRIMVICS